MKTLLIVLCLAGVTFADTLTTIDGKTYDNVRVSATNATGVKIIHKAGIANISYSNMSPDDKKKYGYDEGKATALENSRRIVRVVDGKAYDFTPIVEAYDKALRVLKNVPAKELSPPKVKLVFVKEVGLLRRYFLQGKVVQVLPEGLLVDCSDDENFNSDGYDGTVFVVGYKDSERITDGEEIRVNGMPSGRYQYVSTTGATRTVAKFTCGRRIKPEEWQGEINKLPSL